MKRVENYKNYVIDTDNLGRQYIYNSLSPYSESSDSIVIGIDMKLKDIKAIIDIRVETKQDIRSLK